jgi:hypothetical protein
MSENEAIIKEIYVARERMFHVGQTLDFESTALQVADQSELSIFPKNRTYERALKIT